MLVESNGYENISLTNITFLGEKKEYAQQIDACIYFIGRFWNINTGKYNLIDVLCRNVNDETVIRRACKVLPEFYYKVYCKEAIRTILTQRGNGRDYSTAAVAAFIRACTYVAIEQGYFKKACNSDVYIEFLEGYHNYLKDNSLNKDSTLLAYAKFLMNIKDYDDMDVEFRLALAEGTLQYMLDNVDKLEENAGNIYTTIKQFNQCHHTGEADAGMNAAGLIANGLITGEWPETEE